MTWTHCVSDIPIKDWAFFRRIHAVTVDHHIYLFDYNKSCQDDPIQVLIFNPKTSTCSVVQPVGRREECSTDVLAQKGEMILIQFAVAFKGKVYVCVGGRTTSNGGEIHVFDTRTLRWSCVNTSGEVPAGTSRWRVCACEEDGHLYAWAHVYSTGVYSEGTYLWSLEVSSLRWKIVATGGWSDSRFPRCVVSYKNRIYVLLERLQFPLESSLLPDDVLSDDEITYFNLTTKTWESLQPPGTTPLARQLWIPFIHREHIYMFLNEQRINDYDLHKRFGDVNLNEVLLRYSFAHNNWEQVLIKGVTPPVILNSVCVVDNMAVFFSFNKKKAYVLDFFPSLRSLCFQAVSKYKLDTTLLPALLKRELTMYKYRPDDVFFF